jgi:hypothetical protein
MTPGRFSKSTEQPDSHRTSLERLLAECPPRRPRCFESAEQWHEFLITAHESGERVVRRQDTGKWTGQRKVVPILVAHVRQLPCADCEPVFKQRMTLVGRCERVSQGNAARRWLLALLEAGPMRASDVRRIAVDAGFKKDTIYRSAQRLRVHRYRTDPIDQSTTVWKLRDS